MEPLILDQLALPKDRAKPIKPKAKLPHHKTGEKFLKGPIPMTWLCKAAQLPGKSLHVGNALWFLGGLNKSPTVKLNQAILAEFGVTRHCKYRALNWLTNAGLITVQEAYGKNPVVTILAVPEVEV